MSKLEEIKARVEGHTPGPWVYDASIGRVEDVPEFDLHRFDIMAIGIARVEESDADGELIAAAPKLIAALEAVEAVRERLAKSSQVEDREIAENLHAAITEALQ